METEEIQNESRPGSSNVFLEIVVTTFLVLVFLFFLVKFLFF
jgi:hypothetical protein